ncbi:MAG: hypothetical protein WA510_14240 [Acidobacteriaceae bacterium]
MNGSPATPTNPAVVRSQLEKIVSSAPFRNSKRYPALLRYVVEKTLAGASAELKERNIGVDVFGREPSYDLGLDPIVRITAGEVRKRLAQFYQEAAHRNELRIDIPLGSYQPEFIPPDRVPEVVALPTPVITAPVASEDVDGPGGRSKTLILACIGFVFLAGLSILWLANSTSALDRFWGPVISRGNQVLLCVGRAGPTDESHPDPENIDRNYRQVAWWDAETMARLAGLIQAKGGSLRLLREDRATFSDFQQSPAVLIGAFNDQWTLELMQKMRYTFQKSGRVHWIADRDRPSFQDWKVDLNRSDNQGKLDIEQDYAIISRVANPRTGSITVTVAGLWGYGTLAAGRFLTDPKYLDDLAKQAPSGWSKRDMEIVIGTEVIQGSPGPPKVMATAFW